MTPATARTIFEIKRIVCDVFGVDVRLIDTMQKPARLSTARSVAMFFCREFLRNAEHKEERFSYPSIAAAFKRDAHGSAMFAEKSVRERVDIDLAFAKQVNQLRDRLTESLKGFRA